MPTTLYLTNISNCTIREWTDTSLEKTGNFLNQSRWEPSGIPSISDVISIASNNSIVNVNSSTSIGSLVIGSLISPSNTTFNIQSPAHFTVASNVSVSFGSSMTMDASQLNTPFLNIDGLVSLKASNINSTLINIKGVMNTLEGASNIGSVNIYPNGLFSSTFSSIKVQGSFEVSGSVDGLYTDLVLEEALDRSTLLNQKSKIIMTESSIICNQTLTLKNGSSIQIDGNSFFYSYYPTTLFGNSTIFSTNIGIISLVSNLTLFDQSIVRANSGGLELLDGDIMIHGRSGIIAGNGSYLSFENSIITMYDNATVTASNSQFNILNGTFTLHDRSYLLLRDSSSLLINSETETSFVTRDQSFCDIRGDSRVVLTGKMEMMDSSNIYLHYSSFLIINGTLKHHDNSFLNSIDSHSQVIGALYLDGNAKVVLNNSTLSLEGSMEMLEQSFIVMNNSASLQVNGGSLSINSSISCKDSNIIVNTGDLISSNGPITINNSIIETSGNGRMIWNGVTNIKDSTIKSGSRLLSISGSIVGENLTIIHSGTDFKVERNGQFICNHCTIHLATGAFTYDLNSTVILNKTIIFNLNSSSFNPLGQSIYTSIGSGISNSGIINLSSNILKLSNNSNNNNNNNSSNIDNLSEPFLNNTEGGQWTFKSNNNNNNNNDNSSTIQVEIKFNNNQGQVSIGNSTIVVFITFNQSNGTLFLNGGSMVSNEPIELHGGQLHGNGKINGTVDNKAATLGQDNSYSRFTINGNYTQSSNGTLFIDINQNSNSNVNITNETKLDGNLIVRIDRKVLNGTEVVFLQSGQKIQGDFNKIKVLVYDPETGEEDDNPPCQYKAQKRENKYSMLVTMCQDEQSKIPVPIIIGVVMGITAIGIATATLIYFRGKIHRRLQYYNENRKSKRNLTY
ncbi:hypothetical protein DFA_10102 [Cavenderia fasciculata]|uniref:Transmembrane protein n=1 Tax=Cavenderia fasciculata TaxID=261658 RepID=F4Q999_CACFS|nr:uncharacterized protein DFA_10102 [Cavenderia fasciculata]EGG15268.1 hypothetical protein DFA_10102 [Cavenderia fasciculata]|eukprot:XP_004351988.1 hypothetical protein DFA_10102 [Cavenderia fasciculata]